MTTISPAGAFPLAPWDQLLHSIYHQYEGAGAAAVALHLGGSIEPAPLRSALASLQQRHPKLRARLVETGEGRHAFEVSEDPPPIPFELKDHWTDDLPWQEETTRLFAERPDPTINSMARVLVLRARASNRSVLIVVAHHTLGDGLSLLRLVNDLLGYYAEAERGIVARVTPLSIVSPSGARPAGGIWKRLRRSAMLLRYRRENRKADWIRLPPGDGVHPHRRWKLVVLTERDTATLALRCRREKAAMYGALYAAAARGLIVSLGQPRARVKCRIPIDMRADLICASRAITKHDLGNFISGYEFIADVSEGSGFWTLARQARNDMEGFRADGGPSILFNFVRNIKLPNTRQAIRRTTIFVTSYGVVDLRDSYGSLEVEQLFIVFDNLAAGPSILIEGLVVRRRLNLSLGMADLPEAFWERVQGAITSELLEAIQGERNDERAIRP